MADPVSSCCAQPVRTAGRTTRHYECAGCGNPCGARTAEHQEHLKQSASEMPPPAGREPGHPGKTAGVAASAMSEAELDRAIRRILKDLPVLMAYHTYDSRKSAHGWPDLVIARVHVHGFDDGAVMFRELKREDGKVTPAQGKWLEALQWGGCDTGVWRPSDLLSGRIALELAALAGLAADR